MKTKKTLKISFLFGIMMLAFFAGVGLASAATRTWDGGGGDDNWSTCANWSLDTCPVASDTVTFDGTSTKTSTIDASFSASLTTINVNAGYSGTITAGRAFTVTTINQAAGTIDMGSSLNASIYNLNLSGGTFNGNTSAGFILHRPTISGGAFIAPTGWLMSGDSWSITGGTFDHNNGSIQWNAGGSITWNFPGAITLNNLNIDACGGSTCDSYYLTLGSSDTVTIAGDLTLADGELRGANIQLKGDILVGSNYDGTLNGATINMTGTSAQSIDATGATTKNTGTIVVNNASGVNLLSPVTMQNLTVSSGTLDVGIYGFASVNVNYNGGTIANSGGNINVTGTWTHSSGTYNCGSYTTNIYAGVFSGGTFDGQTSGLTVHFVTINGGIFTASSTGTYSGGNWIYSSGTFNHNNGTVVLDSGGPVTFDFPGAVSFNNLTINCLLGGACDSTYTFTLGSSDTVTILGDLSLQNGRLLGSNIQLKGNITVGSSYDGTSTGATITMSGTSAQTINATGATAKIIGNIVINNSEGVSLSSGATMITLGVTSGEFSMGANALTVNSTFSQSGGIFNGGSGILTITGAMTVSGGDFYASSTTNTFSNAYTQSGGTFHGGGGRIYQDGALTINVGATYVSTSEQLQCGSHFTVAEGGGTDAFQHSNGWVMFRNMNGGVATTINVDSTSTDADEIFYNLYLTRGAGALNGTTNEFLIVENALTFNDGTWAGASGASIEARGDVSLTSTFDGGAGLLVFGGGNLQYLTVGASAGGVFNADITINKTAGTYVQLTSNALTLDAASQDLIITSGIFNTSGLNLTVNGTSSTLTVGANGGLCLLGNETITTLAGQPTFVVGGTMRYAGIAGPYTMKDWVYNNATLDISPYDGVTQTNFTLPNHKIFAGAAIGPAGVLVTDGRNLTVTGSFSNNGTLKVRGNETISLTNDTDSGTVQFVGDADAGADSYTVTTLSPTYYNLTINSTDGATDVFQLGTNLDVNNNLTITAGNFDVSVDNRALTIGGNFSRAGTFTPRSGTVTFDDATKTSVISGSTSFYGFRSVTQDKNIQFTAATTQTVTGPFTLTGVSGHKVVLRSTSDGNYWNLNVSGAQSVSYVDAKDSDASSGNAIVGGSTSLDSGHNLNWVWLISVNWTSTSQSEAESIGALTVTASLNGVTDSDVSVPYTITGTATGGGADYTITASPITIPAGQLTSNITINVVDDTFDENNETIVITMGNPTNAAKGADITIHTATLQDNEDPPTVTFTAATQSSAESVASVTVTAQLNMESRLDVTVPFTLTGTAVGSGTDYTLITASPITISSGDTTKDITFTIINDALDEEDETIIITMGSPTNATKGTTTVHTVTLIDDDTPPSIIISDNSVAENDTTATITLTMTGTSLSDVSVDYATSNGTATAGTDYTAASGTITWTAGQTGDKTFNVPITNDTSDENNETVTLTLSNPIVGTISDGEAILTINDNDAEPTVQWTTASQSGVESVGTLTITAQLSESSEFDVTVPFTLSGTASSGDYFITASPITITAGNITEDITITVVDDSLDENNETLIVTMGSPTKATQGTTTVHTATLNDNDAGPTVQWTAASQGGLESAGTLTITAQLSTASGLDISVPFTLGDGTATGDGADYSISASPITVIAGQTTANITLSVVDDVIDESNETVIVIMGSPTNASQGATTVHTATINDNDNVSIAIVDNSVSENGSTAAITVTMTGTSSSTVSVNYATSEGTATAGSDYTATSGTITWTAGQTGDKTFNVSITDDGLDENNETVILALSNAVNSTISDGDGALTINDNDASPTVTWTSSSQSGLESVGTLTLTAELSAVSGRNVSVPYTLSGTAAGNGTDYSITASPITITAGQTTANITLTIVNDTLDENDETAIITMGAPTNATQGETTVHTVTITDNDNAPTVAWTIDSQSAAEGASPLTITAQLSAVSGKEVTIPFTLSGTAIGDGTDYSITASPITISAGTTTSNIMVTLMDDSFKESTEILILTMDSPTNATQGVVTSHTITLNDNDTTPAVTWTVSSQFAAESTGTMTVTAQLSAYSDLDVTVPFTLSGTATGDDTDYSISVSPITISAGDISSNITITLINDSIDENNETVIVTMGSPTNAIQGGITVHTATINDNDNSPTVTWTSSSQASDENVGVATITAQLSSASGLDVSVPFTLTGTATGSGTDYSITASPISITAGQTTATISIAVVDDSLYEDNETVIATMGNPTNASKGIITVNTSTINDNDFGSIPSVSWSVDSQSASEGTATMTITAQLSATSGKNVTIPFTLTGTALGGGIDYSSTPSPITITTGNTTATITLTLSDDNFKELSETIIVTMGSPSNAILGATTIHTATITNNDSSPGVTWTSSSQTISEGITEITLTAALSATSESEITIPFTLTGTATGGGTDYSIMESPIIVSPGDLTSNITVTLIDDSLDENNETVIVTMGSPTNAIQGTVTVHTITIEDNDALPFVQWTAASQSANENAGTMTVTAQLSSASGKDVTVPFTLSGTATGNGTDYSITSSPITITAGQTTAAITITIVNDVLDESDETVIVTMGSPTNATAGVTTVHTSTINDNDEIPTVTWTTSSQSTSEEISTVTLTAQLSVTSGQDVSVPFILTGTAIGNGTDYSITSSPLIIASGTTTSNITITLNNDSFKESNETVIVTMDTPINAIPGSTTAFTLTIENNDTVPLVYFTSSSQLVSEGSPTATVTAQLSAAIETDVTVPFTITGTSTGDGTDYSITASPLTIPAGNTTADVTITLNDDLIDEDAETIIITMGNPVNATVGDITVHTATINDNDATPTVSWTVVSQDASENDGTITVTAQISDYSAFDVIVPFTVSGTSTGSGVDYSITESPVIIPSGSLTSGATITLADDLMDEVNETVILTMGEPINATAGGTIEQTAIIVDDDNPPLVVWTTSSQSIEENVETITVTAQLSTASSHDITVPFIVTGTATGIETDYSITASPITITAGQTSANVTITVINDEFDEPAETVILTMESPTNASLGAITVHTATINISDTPPPTVSWTVANQSVNEEIGTVTITAQLAYTSPLDVTVPFTLSGTATENEIDYSITESPLVIPAGQLSASIILTLTNDALDEDAETVIVTMGSPTNATQGSTTVHTATINDNDATPLVTWDSSSQSVDENGMTVTLTASLSAASGREITLPLEFSGTATGDNIDYSPSVSSITISAGSTSGTVIFTLVNDILDEGNETIIATLSTPINADLGAILVHTVTLNDNPVTPTVSSVGASEVTDGSGKVTISFTIDDPNDDDTLQVLVEYNVGMGWNKATLALSPFIATYGTPTVVNANSYQIGDEGNYILTSSGANTIVVIWDSTSNIANFDITNAQIRITPYDGNIAGATVISSNFVLDQKSPTNGLSDLYVSEINTNDVRLAWTAITNETHFDYYEIFYKPISSSFYTSYSTLTDMTTSGTSIAGLNTGSSYNVYIKAVDDYGNYSLSQILTVTTDSATHTGNSTNIGGDGGWHPTQTHGSSNEDDTVYPLPVEPEISTVLQEFEMEWESQHLEGHWAETYLKNFLEQTLLTKILNGDYEGASELAVLSYFLEPDRQVSRIEFLKSAMDLLGISVDGYGASTSFKDISINTQESAYIEKAYALGIIKGYPDGTFKPLQVINRAEALKIAINLSFQEVPLLYGDELLAYYELPENPFSDVSIDAWYAPYILYAYSNRIVIGYGDKTFKPDRLISLGETAKIITLVMAL
ncbi:MAG: Calx-beta domain-containing protein [Candidatus Gracilibacteria bacterium]